jgi:cytochrome c-type biogenesis protein CcmH/NrfG
MKSESIVLIVAGMVFGVVVGWVLASVNENRTAPAAQVSAPAASSPQQAAAGGDRQPPVLDEARVQALTQIIKNDPTNAGAAVQLGATYFEAEKFDDATKWYEEGVRLDPKNAEASSQLGMTYFLTKGPDAALKQLDRSLEISPNHPRTLLNKGIVLWRGKQDLKGAAAVWETLVQQAPNSPEAQAAKQGLEAIRAAAGQEGAAGTHTNQ